MSAAKMIKKILFLVTGLNVGGAEQQVVALALRFHSLGISVAVVTLIEPGRNKEELFAANIPVYSLGMKRGIPGPGAILKLARIVHRQKPDVVHAHMFHANILARVSRLFWLNVPLICTIHNVNEASARSRNWTTDKTWRDSAYKFTNLLASKTTAICDTAVQRFTDLGVFHAGQLDCVVNGIVVSDFARDIGAGARLRREMGLESKIVGLMVARMEPPKDQALLLRAWAAVLQTHREIHLVLVGDGPNRAELEKLTASLKIVQNVTFTGIRKDVHAFLSMADFFVLITVMEGLPISILEASAASLPIIASNAGGNRDAIAKCETGFLVRPGDVVDLVKSIEKIVSLSPAERTTMGTAAREMIRARFDLDIVVKQWIEIYDRVASRRLHCEI